MWSFYHPLFHTMSNQFKLSDLTMGRDKSFPTEFTLEIKANLELLLTKINAFLNDLAYVQNLRVSSGWRPAAVNKSIQNAAKRSNHMLGLAVDITDDKNQSFAKSVLMRLDLLEKHGLYLEDPAFTIGKFTNWVHLQAVAPRSGKRIFKP